MLIFFFGVIGTMKLLTPTSQPKVTVIEDLLHTYSRLP